MSPVIKDKLKELITSQTGIAITSFDAHAVSGGSINESFKVVINRRDNFFCKINVVEKFPSLFLKEKHGLELLSSYKVIRVPKVYGVITFNDHQALLIEWIEEGPRNEKFWKNFGEQIAGLHSITATSFGLDEDNYMGALHQYNSRNSSWVDFFINQRLEPQLKLAKEQNLISPVHLRKFQKLYTRMPSIFPQEPPCLVHGDLWSGNFLCDTFQQPVLLDPAVYFGHRAIDLGMSTLFGGFHKSFYDAYSYKSPFTSNFSEQWEICNLYPLLIHLNLFGTSYLKRILSAINQY
jgi:fructosamine-3-kinase